MSRFVTSVLTAVLAAISDAVNLRSGAGSEAYVEYRQKYRNGDGSDDALDYATRLALYEERVQEVARHNAQPGTKWRATVNKFSDYSEDEFQALLGHRPGAGHRNQRLSSPAGSLVQISGHEEDENDADEHEYESEGDEESESENEKELAAVVDWSEKTGSVLDQGSCGSCWAVAIAGALQGYAQMKTGKAVNVSFEQIVDCTPNPEQCGGDGGCKGATAELGFEWAAKNGVTMADAYKGYQHGGDGKCHTSAPAALTTTGFVRLPVNKLKPLMAALVEGPVVVNVDASPWKSYDDGVFTSCGKDAVLNHVVLAVGYGHDKKKGLGYWNIRNSWGSDWGEAGFIRLQRHSSSKDHCGFDHEPKKGVACKKDWFTPAPVCGMCGVLADSVVPTGVAAIDL